MDDDQLYKLWENKIKIELSRNITSKKLNMWSVFHNLGHRAVIRLIEKQSESDDIIVEAGCGNCHFATFLKPSMREQYIGLDINSRMLAMAESFVKPIQADIYNMPFPDNRIHLLISIYSLEHLHRIDVALRDIHRVLTDGGIFIFAVPMEGGLLYNIGRHFTTKRIVESKYNIDYMKIIREYEHPNNIFKIMKSVKTLFAITESHYYPFYLPFYNCNLFGVFKAVKI